MKFLIVLFLSAISVLSKDLTINLKTVKSIWDSPELQPALKHFSSKNSKNLNRIFSSRIVRGKSSKPGQFPHYVAMYVDDQWLCGGSVLSSRWILTVRNNESLQSTFRWQLLKQKL